MKYLVFATLLLAASASFAQSAGPETASPEASVGREIGRSMGAMPLIQDACGGYSEQDKGSFNAGLASWALQLTANRGVEFSDGYQKGFREGQTLIKNRIMHLSADEKAALCEDFNKQYPAIAANLKKAELKVKAN